MPAPPGLRVLAAVVDIIILSLPVTIWKAATGDITVDGQTVGATTNPWTWLLNVAYFFILEARWGASLGKRLFGLQLSSPGAGWIARVARRTMVFHIPWLVIALLLVSFGPVGPMSDQRVAENVTLKASETRDLIEGLATLTLVAGLFLTARRRNGWTGLHDLVSGTRVVSRSAARLRTRTAPATATAIDAATLALGKRYGPFRALSDERDGDARLVVGFDPVLRRQVWIHVVSPQTPPIGAVRRDLSRTGRLHWLTGRRNGTDNWDAFEAPDGHASGIRVSGTAR
jgi:eukaryotic-like serine/threonine-protein kinase